LFYTIGLAYAYVAMVILYHALYIVLFHGKLHVIPTFEFIGDQGNSVI